MQINLDILLVLSPIICFMLLFFCSDGGRQYIACLWSLCFTLLCSILLNCLNYNYYSIIDQKYRIYAPFMSYASLICILCNKAILKYRSVTYIIMLYVCINMLILCILGKNHIYTTILMAASNIVFPIFCSLIHPRKRVTIAAWIYFPFMILLSVLTIITAILTEYAKYSSTIYVLLLVINSLVFPLCDVFVNVSSKITIYAIHMFIHLLYQNVIIDTIVSHEIYKNCEQGIVGIVANVLIFITICYCCMQSILSKHIRKRFIYISIFNHAVITLDHINNLNQEINILQYTQCIFTSVFLIICSNILQYTTKQNKVIIDTIMYISVAFQIFISAATINSIGNSIYIIPYIMCSSVVITSIIYSHKISIQQAISCSIKIPMEKIVSSVMNIILNAILIFIYLR